MRDFGWSAFQMFTLGFEMIKPEWKTLVEGIMFHFLPPGRDLAKDLFCFVVVLCVCHETVAWKRCFESNIFLAVMLLLKKGANDFTTD